MSEHNFSNEYFIVDISSINERMMKIRNVYLFTKMRSNSQHPWRNSKCTRESISCSFLYVNVADMMNINFY